DLPKGAANIVSLWRDFIEEQAGGTLEGVDAALDDQAAFARLARRVISDLGYADQLGDDPDAQEPEDDQGEEAEQDQDDPESTGEEEDQSDEGEASPEQSQEEQQDAAQAQVSSDDMAEMEEG